MSKITEPHHKLSHRSRRNWVSIAVMASVVSLVSGCASGGNPAEGERVSLTFATVNTPQTKDLEELKGQFEKTHPNISVDFIQMNENDLRDAVTKDIATGGGQYDVVTIGSYEVPIWGKNGWLTDLDSYATSNPDYDVEDFLPVLRDSLSFDDSLYAAPFYGEGSFLMYNKEIFAAEGLSLPEHPTWTEVDAAARQIAKTGTPGICLRGQPGWGSNIPPLTTAVQTFGGTWFDNDWNAKLDSPEFIEATTFYTDLITDAGQPDPVSSGFVECLNLFAQGGVAMWYDATAAAGMLESAELSSVVGKVGYVHAPVMKTEEAGWLWSWNLAIPKSSKKQDAAWQFIEWATDKDYVKLAGEELGWTRIPAGARESTYEIPEYREAAAAFADITLDVMKSVDPKQPGLKPQPWVGIQYVTIPEFQDLGNQVSQEIADVLGGRTDVPTALKKAQKLAQKVGDAQKK